MRRQRPFAVQYFALVLALPFAALQFYLSLQHVSSDAWHVYIPGIAEGEEATARPERTTSQQNSSSLGSRIFPRWDDENGIPLRPLLDFIHGVKNETATTIPTRRQREEYPETLYVVDERGLWTSGTIRSRTKRVMFRGRLMPTEGVAKLGLKILRNATSLRDGRWRKLQRAVYDGGGFPFIAWYGDYKSCNSHNWNNNHSIPLFTTCAHVNCKHAFPFPTYKTIMDSKESSEEWKSTFEAYNEKYPWKSKNRKVVWRGSLSGKLPEFEDNPRWRLGQHVTEHPSDLLDMGLVAVPDRHKRLNLNMSIVGGFVNRMPQEDFQRYTAILDTDGNSWSSRFGSLLCYNSVILKVEPMYVDYFHLKDLQPWKHFVPVKYDLSDLLEKSAFVTDPKNEAAVKQIIAGANEWCQTRMVPSSIAHDYLDIWEAYVGWLDKADPNWMGEWKKEKARIFDQSSAFDMVQL